MFTLIIHHREWDGSNAIENEPLVNKTSQQNTSNVVLLKLFGSKEVKKEPSFVGSSSHGSTRMVCKFFEWIDDVTNNNFGLLDPDSKFQKREEIDFKLEYGSEIVKENLNQSKARHDEVMEDAHATFDNILEKHIEEEMNVVRNDVDDDGSIGGKEPNLETFMEVENHLFQQNNVVDCGIQLIGLQLLQLDLSLGKIPSRSFRPLKSAVIFWLIWASCSLGVPFALDRSWSKWELSVWLFG
ncbi:hypothetical protein Tco_1069039 [Tanacetum coccineum]|uniref:Uncharacterized protein n=1 Tax=Tanacetum coccineum TaxID=301880 RepID=A0ABQ5HJA9_9ASTR